MDGVDQVFRFERIPNMRDLGGCNSLSDEALLSLTGVRREWLDTLFERIEDRFGSVLEYLMDRAGVDTRKLALLRETYLEPAGG